MKAARRIGRRIAFAAVALALLLAFGRMALPFAMEPGALAINYVENSARLSSAGMPRRAQFARIAEAGFDMIVNLAPSDAAGAHADERALVEGAGMAYFHVPVDFAAPRPADFARFAAILRANPGKRVLVHCQVNLRASSFVFLYRVMELGEDPDKAYDDVMRVWQPSGQWRKVIREVLEAGGKRAPMALAA